MERLRRWWCQLMHSNWTCTLVFDPEGGLSYLLYECRECSRKWKSTD